MICRFLERSLPWWTVGSRVPPTIDRPLRRSSEGAVNKTNSKADGGYGRIDHQRSSFSMVSTTAEAITTSKATSEEIWAAVQIPV